MPRTTAHPPRSRSLPAQAVRVNEQPPEELKLERGTERGGRVGDPRRRYREEFPAERNREAGLTGASMPGGEPTADDAAREVLLDENLSHTPNAHRDRDPTDTLLTPHVESQIGGGTGLDEAELAERRPVGRKEASRLARKAAKHARDPNFFEHHEAASRSTPGPGRVIGGDPDDDPSTKPGTKPRTRH